MGPLGFRIPLPSRTVARLLSLPAHAPGRGSKSTIRFSSPVEPSQPFPASPRTMIAYSPLVPSLTPRSLAPRDPSNLSFLIGVPRPSQIPQ